MSELLSAYHNGKGVPPHADRAPWQPLGVLLLNHQLTTNLTEQGPEWLHNKDLAHTSH